MKGTGKTNDQTKTLQKAAQKPAESKQLPLANEGISPLAVDANKTREQFCDELCRGLEKAAGVPIEVADRMTHQMGSAMVWPKPQGDTELLIKAITGLREYAPQNAIEASLAAQMTATGETALLFLNRATLPNQPLEVVDRIVAHATRLMRLHLEQIEAMQKLKGKAGQQKVTVEHVHVHEGGQAIVGALSTTKGSTGESQ
jgi:hypothetical protein